jgi:hypothetical protein
MKRNILILLLLVTLGFAQSASGPVVQMVDYNIVPSSLYQGSTGQLELTLENSGTETAKGVTVYYNYDLGYQSSIFVGQIGPDARAITTIPFKVPDKVDSGMITLALDVYYLSENEASSKHSAASIPVAVSQHRILEVSTLSLSKDTLRKGDTMAAEIQITNLGGVMKDVAISSANSSQFSLSGTTQQRVGDIPANSSRNVSVILVSSSSAEAGKYLVPLKVTYNDALQNVNEETVFIGPVTVSGSSSSFKVSCAPASPSEIGSELAYNITLENPGGSVQSAVVVIGSSDIFTPVGQNTVYFDDIQPGESRSQIVYLGIDSTASSGFYVLPMTIKTSSDDVPFDAGIYVQATPGLTLTSETESSGSDLSVTVKVANSGNTAIRSVYARAGQTDGYSVVGSAEKFIGTLSVDDYSTFQMTLRPRGMAYESVPVVISFKDNDNVEHTVTRLIPVGPDSNQTSGFGGNASASGNRTIRGSPFGGPMGGAQADNIPMYAGIGVVLLGALYFGYRKVKGKPKPVA